MLLKTSLIAAAAVAPVFGEDITGPIWTFPGVTVSTAVQGDLTTFIGKCTDPKATSTGSDGCPFGPGGRTFVHGPTIHSYHAVSPNGLTIDNDCTYPTPAYMVCDISTQHNGHSTEFTQTVWTGAHYEEMTTSTPWPTPSATPSVNTASATDSSSVMNTAMSMSTNTGTASGASGTQGATTTATTTTSTENAGIQATGYAWAMGGAAAAAALAAL